MIVPLDNHLTAYTTLAYKSDRTHSFDETVATARERVRTAIRRKSIKWAKVVVTSPDGTKQRIHTFTPGKGWSIATKSLPRAKD